MFASPGWAQSFDCTARTAGQLSVQANVQRVPVFGGERAAQHARWLPVGLRHLAGTDHEATATANLYPYPLAAALSADRALILQDRGRPPVRLTQPDPAKGSCCV
jgi:hypothetical protein